MTTEQETPVTAPAKRMTLRGKVEVLTAEVAELKRQRAIVGALLRDEAYEREWCSDYNYFVDNVNRACGDAWLVPLECDEEE